MADSVCEACGWAAAFVAMLAFGSFGAPIKSDAAKSVDVDPLVFQSYKSFMCLITSPIVLLLGHPFTFTPWGIVSGLFWVPGGVATVYAIKSAGLALAIGIGSSMIVFVSFFWGIFLLNEPVHSRLGACIAIALMMIGLSGMAFYSSPHIAEQVHFVDDDAEVIEPERVEETSRDDDSKQARGDGYQGLSQAESDQGQSDLTAAVEEHMEIGRTNDYRSPKPTDLIHVCGCKVSRRETGIAAAVFNGVWGGSIMVPMKWSPGDTNGLGYVISFAIGAWIITLLLWLLRYLFFAASSGSFVRGYHQLPSLHVRVMWLMGGSSGLLWSTGNIFSMISVRHLGEGVGYSVCQAAMLISGLWGIYYFREVVRQESIVKWFASALLTVCGILLLSYQHHAKR